MILTGSMNRPGGVWFRPGVAYQLEEFELPIPPPDGSFGPGPPSRRGTQSFMGEWPCAALPDEIEAGNILAVLNLGGSLLTSIPNTGVLEPALRKLEVLATTEISSNDTAALSTHVLPTKDQLARARATSSGQTGNKITVASADLYRNSICSVSLRKRPAGAPQLDRGERAAVSTPKE